MPVQNNAITTLTLIEFTGGSSEHSKAVDETSVFFAASLILGADSDTDRVDNKRVDMMIALKSIARS